MATEAFTKNFNTGVLTIMPSGSNPTPIRVATLKDVSLDISYSIKELRGSNAFPEDIAPADGKITGKAKSGRIFGAILQAVMQGMTSAAGQKFAVYDERGTIPAVSGPYTITAAQSATWSEDLGVIDITTGLPMACVATAPTTGQYAVAAGVYTFAAADTTHVVSLRYTYSPASTGRTLSLVNSIMGANTAKYALHVYNTYDGASSGFKLYSVQFPKLGMAWKAGDYAEVDLDFVACADSSGRVMDYFKL